MTEQHPITPPPELVQQWYEEYDSTCPRPPLDAHMATRAAQWGADQELEECCEWVEGYAGCGRSLRYVRRPNPPSLKEQALKALGDAVVRGDNFAVSSAIPAIRRALEALRE